MKGLINTNTVQTAKDPPQTTFNGQRSIGTYTRKIVPYSDRFLVLCYRGTATALTIPEIAYLPPKS